MDGEMGHDDTGFPGFAFFSHVDFQSVALRGAVLGLYDLALFDDPVDLSLGPALFVVGVDDDDFVGVFGGVVEFAADYPKGDGAAAVRVDFVSAAGGLDAGLD